MVNTGDKLINIDVIFKKKIIGGIEIDIIFFLLKNIYFNSSV